MRFRTIRRQRPVKGGRHPLPACVLKEIDAWVVREATRFGVSKSFVVATALAYVAGIKTQERYDVTKDKVVQMRKRA